MRDRDGETMLTQRPGVPAGAVAIGVAAAVGGLALFSHLAARRVEKDIPADGQFVEAGGVRLHYRDICGGRPGAPAIVMIHGLGGQMRNFSYALVDQLAGRDARDGHRVILVDRPGSGYSGRHRGRAANVRAQAEVMAAFIDALRLERPLIVGHSLGGGVAMALALDHPDKVGGLALIAPLTQAVHALPEAVRRGVVATAPLRRVLTWTLATPVALATRAKVLKLLFAPEPVPGDFGTRGGGWLTVRPDALYATSRDTIACNDDMAGLAARYGELRVPVGIMFGRDDRVLDPQLHGVRTAREVPGIDLELIDGGHLILVTQPDTAARWIKGRLGKLAVNA